MSKLPNMFNTLLAALYFGLSSAIHFLHDFPPSLLPSFLPSFLSSPLPDPPDNEQGSCMFHLLLMLCFLLLIVQSLITLLSCSLLAYLLPPYPA